MIPLTVCLPPHSLLPLLSHVACTPSPPYHSLFWETGRNMPCVQPLYLPYSLHSPCPLPCGFLPVYGRQHALWNHGSLCVFGGRNGAAPFRHCMQPVGTPMTSVPLACLTFYYVCMCKCMPSLYYYWPSPVYVRRLLFVCL